MYDHIYLLNDTACDVHGKALANLDILKIDINYFVFE